MKKTTSMERKLRAMTAGFRQKSQMRYAVTIMDGYADDIQRSSDRINISLPHLRIHQRKQIDAVSQLISGLTLISDYLPLIPEEARAPVRDLLSGVLQLPRSAEIAVQGYTEMSNSMRELIGAVPHFASESVVLESFKLLHVVNELNYEMANWIYLYNSQERVLKEIRTNLTT